MSDGNEVLSADEYGEWDRRRGGDSDVWQRRRRQTVRFCRSFVTGGGSNFEDVDADGDARSLHEFNELVGPITAFDGSAKHLEYFQLFYSNNVFAKIADFTKGNAHNKFNRGGRRRLDFRVVHGRLNDSARYLYWYFCRPACGAASRGGEGAGVVSTVVTARNVNEVSHKQNTIIDAQSIIFSQKSQAAVFMSESRWQEWKTRLFFQLCPIL